MSSLTCCTKTNEAAKAGHLRCLQTICSKRGFTWQSKHHKGACLLASRHGHLTCLKYAHQRGCPLDDFSDLQIEDYLIEKNAVNAAIVGGHLDCLKYAHQEARIELTEDAYIAASVRGHLNCLVYLREQGLEWYPGTIAICARYGHLDCLKYAFENGAPYSNSAFDIQDENGDGEIANFSPDTLAAAYGHLDCLKYLCDKEVFQYLDTVHYAIHCRQLHCARYLIDRGHCCTVYDFWMQDNRLDLSSLDDPVWRNFFFNVALFGKAPLIKQIVDQKRLEIQQIKEESTCLVSEGKMSSDVLQYIMYLYI